MSSYHVVEINEADCIGCTKCIEVCPVDAILGAAKQIHHVLTEYCIGCNLCLAPCPTHCITTVSTEMSQGQRQNQAKVAKKRVQARKKRIAQHLQHKVQADNQAVQNIQASIAAAIARSQQKTKSFTWAKNE